MNLFNIITNIFVFKECYGCQKDGSYLCLDCLQKYVKISMYQKCFVCERYSRVGLMHNACKSKSYLDGLIYLTNYQGIVKKMIQESKYLGYFAVMKELGIIYSQYLKRFYTLDDYIITSVPMFWFKKNYRGFNQAEVLGQVIAKENNIHFVNLIKRSKNTKKQAGKSRKKRLESLKNVFEYNNYSSFKKVILVDDVFTTGTTLNECAKVLKDNGVEEVVGVVLAKA